MMMMMMMMSLLLLLIPISMVSHQTHPPPTYCIIHPSILLQYVIPSQQAFAPNRIV